MNAPRLELKRPSGWFAAGTELRLAAERLSDGAFKVFVWICLHADRNSGRLRATAADLARSLNKPEGEVRGYLDELVQAGVCRSRADLITVRDSYWPYQRTPTQPDSDDSEAFVASVRQTFLSQACVSGSFSPADERLAAEWGRRGVSLEQVERAIHLGVARKYTALINHGAGTPITTLYYFQPLVEEVGKMNAPTDYWQHVVSRSIGFERRWRALQSPSSLPSTASQETK